MNIMELYKQELAYWKKQNVKLFGVEPIDETLPFSDIQAIIDECCAKYWNSDKPCKLVRHLNSSDRLDKDVAKRKPNSFQLKLNVRNMCIDMYAEYDDKGKYKLCKIGAFPTPSNDLSWIVNYAHYTPRITALRDLYTIISKVDENTIIGEGWKYFIDKDEFTGLVTKNVFEPDNDVIFNAQLSYRSKCLLQAFLDKELTASTFKEAMRNMPIIPNDSVFAFKYMRLEYFENIIFKGTKFAKPLTGQLLGINRMFVSPKKLFSEGGNLLDGALTATTSKIEALESFRTVCNIYRSDTGYKPAFTYDDTIGIFDSFRTVTSGEAGRQRLLLDNVFVRHGMLYITEEGKKEQNFFYYYKKPQEIRLSCLSYAPFCNNDKAKRIMMNAKLTSQSVPLEEEVDGMSHRILARVGFCDLGGYSYADSIIISESFAERLRTKGSKVFYIKKGSEQEQSLLYNRIEELFTKGEIIGEAYENLNVDRVEYIEDIIRVFVSWEIPFRLGDKITNLHGAKGTVGLILPDDKMPKLLNEVGNMEAGPLEIIISGFSTTRRVSLGQIFEAWSLASGIEFKQGEDFASIAVERYQKEMNEYAEKSIVEYNGEQMRIPLGLNNIMRIHHHAFTHISPSGLRFGEMELLHLAANGCTAIMKELDLRSNRMDYSSMTLQRTRELPDKIGKPRLAIEDSFKVLGYELDYEDEGDETDEDKAFSD